MCLIRLRALPGPSAGLRRLGDLGNWGIEGWGIVELRDGGLRDRDLGD